MNFARHTMSAKLVWNKVLKVEQIEEMLFQLGELKKKKVINVSYIPIPDGWIKLNFDGALKNNSMLAGYGGFCKESDGRWIDSFVCNLRRCNSFVAKL